MAAMTPAKAGGRSRIPLLQRAVHAPRPQEGREMPWLVRATRRLRCRGRHGGCCDGVGAIELLTPNPRPAIDVGRDVPKFQEARQYDARLITCDRSRYVHLALHRTGARSDS